ncbi:MAG TPA: hypothetical protein VLV18_01060, partial [Terriglobales bacterium]|nr:hypothetical protein [Terriglobales bacterium]
THAQLDPLFCFSCERDHSRSLKNPPGLTATLAFVIVLGFRELKVLYAALSLLNRLLPSAQRCTPTLSLE